MYKKHIILGIGIGVFISSLIFFISFFIYQYTVVDDLVTMDYSDDYIVERATDMGMIFFDRIDFETTTVTNEDGTTSEEVAVDPEEYVYVSIPKDATAIEIAEIFEEAGLIEDKVEFTNYIIDENLSRNLQFGDFLIKKGKSYSELLEILTK